MNSSILQCFKRSMSLVGPRPPLPYEVEKYEPGISEILEVKTWHHPLARIEEARHPLMMVRLDVRYAGTGFYG